MSSVPMDSALTQCDLEPITRLGRIQAFGFLLAVSRGWTVIYASANLEAFLGLSPDTALGAQIDSLVDPEALHEIRNQLIGLYANENSERLYDIALVSGRPALDIAVHYSGETLILEGEIAGARNRVDAASLVRTMLARLSKQPTLEACHNHAARQLRTMTGFDRVMIYRFEADGSGEVIAEARAGGMESFLGLHYPSSDIPVQARALYLRNTFRIIADASSASVPLIASTDPGEPARAAQPLDLSLALTRAVAPVHIEYLQNMGVAASLSISIVVDGMLWGLIACHHRIARLPSFVTRAAAELFGQMYSMTVESRLRNLTDRADRRGLEAITRLLAAIAADGDQLSHASWLQDQFTAIIQCDGVAVRAGGRLSLSGSTPTSVDIEALAHSIDMSLTAPLVATDNLTSLLPHLAAFAQQAAGVLCIPASHGGSDYIMLFRKELVREITWAGEPIKRQTQTDLIPRISPRKSFAAYCESIRGRSAPFTAADRRFGEAIRSGFSQVVVRDSRNSEAERARTNQRQELLIAELNHRVKNVLALIRGLISQTTGESGDAASYVRSLSGRVQALARAHDRVTRQDWGPAPLLAIFEDEIAAYVPTERHRFTINGPQILLQPQAFSTFSLIIHELVTNCTKYGSLSGDGRVEVTLNQILGVGLSLKWRERDGPRVTLPTRRGFGSVIIERVLPFDLQGTATVQYLPEGFEADFFVPDVHIASSTTLGFERLSAALAQGLPPAASMKLQPLDGRKVILLEDNLIVALEVEELLRSLGADTVHAVSTVAAASRLLDAEVPGFAVLDINLGGETSSEFARRLRARSVPFIFATGYGQDTKLSDFDLVATVSKPYDREQLGVAILVALAAV